MTRSKLSSVASVAPVASVASVAPVAKVGYRQDKPYHADKIFVIFEEEAGQRGCLRDLTRYVT